MFHISHKERAYYITRDTQSPLPDSHALSYLLNCICKSMSHMMPWAPRRTEAELSGLSSTAAHGAPFPTFRSVMLPPVAWLSNSVCIAPSRRPSSYVHIVCAWLSPQRVSHRRAFRGVLWAGLGNTCPRVLKSPSVWSLFSALHCGTGLQGSRACLSWQGGPCELPWRAERK